MFFTLFFIIKNSKEIGKVVAVCISQITRSTTKFNQIRENMIYDGSRGNGFSIFVVLNTCWTVNMTL